MKTKPVSLRDNAYTLLLSRERANASQDEFRSLIDIIYSDMPQVKSAMPQFSTFGLLEALRKATPKETVHIGSFAQPYHEACEIMNRLSPQDVSRSYFITDPNNPNSWMYYTALGFLAGFTAFESRHELALSAGICGGIAGALISTSARVAMRNNQNSPPQWNCALHVDRYLHGHFRNEDLTNIHVSDLPCELIRRKPPYYDLANQIVTGKPLSFNPKLKKRPDLSYE